MEAFRKKIIFRPWDALIFEVAPALSVTTCDKCDHM